MKFKNFYMFIDYFICFTSLFWYICNGIKLFVGLKNVLNFPDIEPSVYNGLQGY